MFLQNLEQDNFRKHLILDRNPLEINYEEIKEIYVLETIIRGKSVFKKDGVV